MKKYISFGEIMLGALALTLIAHAPLFAQKIQRPNIILVLVDDLGFSDTGPYGAYDLETPNINRLASEGLKLKEFYNNSRSAPTQASLLTGQYQHKAGPGYFNVNKKSLTLAEVLKKGGYSTIISGKWHVGGDESQLPEQGGFDKSFGFIGDASNYYEINEKGTEDVKLLKNNKPYYLSKDKYLTEEITNNALEFLDEQDQEKKPFFLYLAYNAPHGPLQALPEDIAKYKGRYNMGWDSLRTLRHKNAIEEGVIDKDQKITVKDDTLQAWNKLTYDEQQYWQTRQEVYAAMIDRVDQGIGRVLSKLKELKKDDNTLIVFVSDNGDHSGDTLKRYTSRNTGPVGTAGSYELQNSNWSQAGNSPFRNYKGTPYEGSISTPFIAWYPKKIKANTIAKGRAHLIDLAPTCYQLAGVSYPVKYKGVPTNALPGKSLVPVLTGQADELNRDEPLFWERAGNKAVRDRDWKLVSTSDGKFELYDIEKDRSENTDLAAQYPDVVQQLKQQYNAWAARNEVVDYNKLKRN